MSNMISSVLPDRKTSLLRRINAFTCEKASSIGFRSGEYGGKYSIRTPGVFGISVCNTVELSEITKAVGELQNLFSMMNACIVHDQDAQRTRVGSTQRHLLYSVVIIQLSKRKAYHFMLKKIKV